MKVSDCAYQYKAICVGYGPDGKRYGADHEFGRHEPIDVRDPKELADTAEWMNANSGLTSVEVREIVTVKG